LRGCCESGSLFCFTLLFCPQEAVSKAQIFLAPKSLRQLADGLYDYQHLKEPPLGGRGQKTAFEIDSFEPYTSNYLSLS